MLKRIKMRILNTYCQVEFLSHLFENFPDTPIHDMFLHHDELLQKWLYIYEVIFRKSNLHVDDKEEILSIIRDNNVNPFWLRLINAHNSGGSRIHQCNEHLDHFDNLYPSGLFYFSELNDIPHDEKGVFLNDIETWSELILPISNRITRTISQNNHLNNFEGWNILSEIGLPINAAVISDRYFLRKPRAYNSNIYKILEYLIPSNLSVPFHLTIITSFEKAFREQLCIQQLSSYFDDRFIENELTFSLFSFSVNELPHDRHILTNYYRIQSGHSFDYFNENGNINRDSTFDILPLNSESQDNYLTILKILRNIVHDRNPVIGDGVNRLFSFIH